MRILPSILFFVATQFVMSGCRDRQSDSTQKEIPPEYRADAPPPSGTYVADQTLVVSGPIAMLTLSNGTVAALSLGKSTANPITGEKPKCPSCIMYSGRVGPDTYVVYIEGSSSAEITYYRESFEKNAISLGQLKEGSKEDSARTFASHQMFDVKGKEAVLTTSIHKNVRLSLKDGTRNPVTGEKQKCLCKMYTGDVGKDTYVVYTEGSSSAEVIYYGESRQEKQFTLGDFKPEDSSR